MMADTPILTHSEQLDQLGTALAKAQAEIVGAKKDSANPFFKSDYADLASVWTACRKPLTANGLSVVQMPIMEAGAVGVSTLLLHASGQWIASTLHANPKDLGPQAVGSVITYLRRYALAAMAGVSQIDDDANAAEGHQKPAATTRAAAPAPPPPATPTRQPGDEPDDPFGNMDDEDRQATALADRTEKTVPAPASWPRITTPQQKRLFAVAMSAGWTKEGLREWLTTQGYAHSNEIAVAHYDDLISAIQAGPKVTS